MTKQEIINELEKMQQLFDGFAGYYGIRNFKREMEGERKSNIDQTKYETFGYCADEIKNLLNAIKEEA